ncbi:MAG TPA: TIR domain-containing protein, partial [Edaphobacter sp.]|nr:TIR domain-containing protein [Edaphobacter sp.]
MLPPVLEIFVVHHPDEPDGAELARDVFAHFHGTPFSGLMGGAVEVYVRAEPWVYGQEAPRPIVFADDTPSNGLSSPRLFAIVLVLGNVLARAVQHGDAWTGYIHRILQAQSAHPDRVGIFPVALNETVVFGTLLGELLHNCQRIGASSGLGPPEPPSELRCRDLAQGIVQLIAGPANRLQVFISHTHRVGLGEEEDVPSLIKLVREIIAETRLRYFFDASDLQPGRNWDAELRYQAASSALVALRTDLYASRAWCQREMRIAKHAGMPIVILDSLGRGEERGSFLMDHIPRIPIRDSELGWSKADIRRGLNLLVDECLKRALWEVQRSLAADRKDLSISWWAPHAPEPVTLAHWLRERASEGASVIGDGNLRVLHPDPPLGPDELEALAEMVAL